MAKEKLYTEAQLFSFGKFLLSDRRNENWKDIEKENPGLKGRPNVATEADLSNWKGSKND